MKVMVTPLAKLKERLGNRKRRIGMRLSSFHLRRAVSATEKDYLGFGNDLQSFYDRARKILETPDAAADGKAALRALNETPYDLVLMDCQMPEMDGYEAARRIRAGSSGVRNAEVPIIAMTAHAMQGDREKCLEAGMNDYLAKPVQPKTLNQILNRWLSKAGGRTTHHLDENVQAEGFSPEERKAVFDEKDLLERLMGDRDMARTVIAAFTDDVPKQILRLKAFLHQGDVSAIVQQAHSIKGASANVGAAALRADAFEIEKAGRDGRLDRVAEVVPKLENRLNTLRIVLSSSGYETCTQDGGKAT